MPKYRKKPVVIEAWQFSKKNFSKGVPDFIKYAPNEPVTLFSQFGGDVIGGWIHTLEGEMQVSENDYIIQGVQGEFYPCKPDIFEATYENADDSFQAFGTQNINVQINADKHHSEITSGIIQKIFDKAKRLV